MEQLLGIFGQRVSQDQKILSFAEGRQVTVRYELNDVNLRFYTTFDQGAVRCGVGEPPEKPHVTLKMKAELLDRLFTGRENGPKAAMSGKLSFIGDTIKAMSLQRIQKDLNRLYTEARGEVGDLDAIFERAAHAAPGQSHRRLRPPLRRLQRGNRRRRSNPHRYPRRGRSYRRRNVRARTHHFDGRQRECADPGQRRNLDHAQFVLQGRASCRYVGARRS